jgi:hypothetical protein
MSQQLSTKTTTEEVTETDKKWFSTTTWFLLLGLGLLNVGCFLQPSVLDTVMNAVFNMLDFRTWPWWYFLCLIIVMAFSVKWFILYQKKVNDDFDEMSLEEAKWFNRMSYSATGLFVLLFILHQTKILGMLYRQLTYMYVMGGLSFPSLLLGLLVVGIICLFIWLIGKWISCIRVD